MALAIESNKDAKREDELNDSSTVDLEHVNHFSKWKAYLFEKNDIHV